MNYKQYIGGIGISFVTSALAFLLIFFKMSPYGTNFPVIRVLFFLTLFLALSSFISLIFCAVRAWYYGELLMLKHIFISLRQGVLLGLFVVVALVLESFRLLTWWNTLLTCLIVVLLELYFLSREEEGR